MHIHYTPGWLVLLVLIYLVVGGGGADLIARPAYADTTPASTPAVVDDGAYTSSATKLHATWNSADAESGIVEYQYRVLKNSTSGTIIVNWTSTGTVASVTRTGLSLLQGTSYYIQVKARNGANLWSSVGSSNGIKIDTTVPTAPGRPTEGSSTSDRDYDTDGQYTVYWTTAGDAESGINKYEMQERIGTSGTWTSLSNTITGTSFPVNGRLNDKTYYYRVRATNGAGLAGAFSPVSDGILVDTRLPQVSSVSVTGVTDTTASFNWSVDEVASCTLLNDTTLPPTQWYVTTGPGSFHAVGISSLTATTTYYASVTCKDAAGNVSAPSTASFTTTGGTASVPTQPSILTINGRQLLLQRRNPDGNLSPAMPYIIRGVNWSPAGPTTATSSIDANNVNVRRPEFGMWYLTDIPLLKAMNVNTVRLFMDPGLPGDSTVTVPGLTILDELYRNGIMVIMTVDNANNTVSRIQPVVDHYKNHPAILLWSLGSEWNINRFFKPGEFPTVDSAAAALESAAQLVKSRDTVHPVVSSYGTIVNRPNEIEKYVTQACPSVDIWSLNEYRGSGFSQLFEQWRFISDKPMFLGEYGIDAFNSTIQQEDQATHAQWNGRLWDEIARNLSAKGPNNVALGGAIFEWNDEWWKTPPWSTQDPGGWNPIAFPDGMASEDWWGIVDINRGTRQLYGALTTRFAISYQPPVPTKTVTYRAVSHEEPLARFWENGALIYEGLAATVNDAGGRGFNIAAINPATGRLREPIQRFDTWATRNSGTNMNAMIAYLDGLPNGTIVLIAVGDEGGLNSFPPDGCTLLPYSWVTTALNQLESLGSTQILDYCYWDQWAMIAIKGQGVALSEALGRAGVADAPTQATIHLP